jgi:sugar phosphate isomerase/epimerase
VTSNLRIGLWAQDLKLGVKAGLNAAARLRPESLGLDAFAPEIAPREIGQSGRRDLARHARNVAPLAALKADLGGRRLSDPQSLEVGLLRIREALDLARDAGVPRLCVPLGFVPAQPSVDDPSYRALLEAAKVLAALAAGSSTLICILAGTEPAATLSNFLNATDPGGILGVEFSPGAFTSRDQNVLDAFSLLGPRIALFSANDHYRGGGEAPFGKGDTRWGEVMAAASTLNRAQPIDILAGCNLDGDRVGALGGAITALKQARLRPF